MPSSSRRKSRRRHRGGHGSDLPGHPEPGYPEPGYSPDEHWDEPADAHASWVAQLYHEPAPWRSEGLPEWDLEPPPPVRYDEYGPVPDYHPDYDLGPRFEPDRGYQPEPAYRPEPGYPAGDFDDGYEQHGPDETPALRGRLVRLPRRRADLPEAVRDCLHWGIFALVLVPVFLIATGGSVLNAILVVIAMLVLGVVVIGVVRLGQIALPNLEPAHQLEALDPDGADPIEAEWADHCGPGEPGPQWSEPGWEPEWEPYRPHGSAGLVEPPPVPYPPEPEPYHPADRAGLAQPPPEPYPPEPEPYHPADRAGLAQPPPEPYLLAPEPEPYYLPPAPAWPPDLDWRPEHRAPATGPSVPERERESTPPSWPHRDR